MAPFFYHVNRLIKNVKLVTNKGTVTIKFLALKL